MCLPLPVWYQQLAVISSSCVRACTANAPCGPALCVLWNHAWQKRDWKTTIYHRLIKLQWPTVFLDHSLRKITAPREHALTRACTKWNSCFPAESSVDSSPDIIWARWHSFWYITDNDYFASQSRFSQGWKNIFTSFISVKCANITKIVSYKLTSCIENFTEVKVCIISKM